MSKAWTMMSVFITFCLVVFTGMGSFSAGMPAVADAALLDFVVDHTAADASVIPQNWLDVARQQVVYFNHRSIGGNVMEGMVDLAAQNPTRYSINIDYGSGTNAGINHYMAGENGDPMSKISGFSARVQNGHNIAFMKFCVGDFVPFTTVPAADIWTAYRDAMESLQVLYPNTVLVWMTSP
ncbi:MAG: hypothetical protein JXA89_16540, partial [Anaerolineae bacterium]|nr:hypothetical protein [Anaerolineae bacterium]